jgi:hypothetical protein
MSQTDITDITWAAMTDAGIDIDHVNRRPTASGYDEYILIEGDTKVAFGPAMDMDDGSTRGYGYCCYGRAEDEGWDEFRQDWAETVEDLLGAVAAVAYPRCYHPDPKENDR